jgi:hypothetical protein
MKHPLRTAVRVHREAHGLATDHLYQVEEDV